ncbi:MAG TPA: PIN domain-containing protein [Chitinophagales bacterium]|nr:PIN domain-containing protein [Chitinophagales bacterium]HMW12452.1 PIN domain-containing protein [Chitinophagales bacterium]HMX59763.1 PIN domain-containing protein [Chitinophagales bacterium]HMY22571.1 PIN domain-containing protein [Chitinophagales bacterium]HMZ33419.1 PIN domain-containing protein [Chitinophagales bacterium]
MIVISDTNIIVSALISPNGAVANILNSKRKFKIIAPDFLLDEIDKHFDKILINSILTERKELKALISYYKEKITFIPIDEIPQKDRLNAYKLVNDIDIDDLPFVALSIHKKCLLWTSDIKLINGLKKKGFTKVITTSELKKFIYKK